MPFDKNKDTINKEGRPKGSKNKLTYDLREKINDFLNDNIDKVVNDFNQLEPKDKIKFYIDFLQFVIPKYQSMKLDADIKNTNEFSFPEIVVKNGL